MKRTFDEWMEAVDAHLRKTVYLSASDLPDCPYYDWFERKMKPETAARKAIKNMNE